MVLRQDKHLMLFPVISGVALLLVLAAFALPLFGLGSIDGIGRGGIYSAVLYRYAVGGSDAPGFDRSQLESAFRQKS